VRTPREFAAEQLKAPRFAGPPPQARPAEPSAEASPVAAPEARARVRELLAAVGAITSPAELDAVLRRVIETAVTLTGARYGALGVLDQDGRLTSFVPTGLDDDQVRSMTQAAGWPRGAGLLGDLAGRTEPLRVADLGARPGFAGFPPGHPAMRTFLGTPVRVGGEAYGSLYLTDKKDGGQFGTEEEGLAMALAAVAGVALDNSRKNAETERQRQWVRAHAEVTQRLLSDDEPTAVLTMVAEQALAMSGADLAFIALPAGGPDIVSIQYAAGEGASAALGLASPTGHSASGIVMATGRPLVMDDLSDDLRAAEVVRERLRLGPAVLVPVGRPGDVRGVLTAGRRRGSPPLSPAAVDMVTTFAAQAGIGIELAERRQAAQRVALFADRDRIARDLHDLVIQRLFATGMSLQGATSLIRGGEAAGRVQQAVDDLDETISDIRAAIFRLQDRGQSGRPGVQAQIVAIAEEMTRAMGFAPWLRMDGRLDSRVPANVAEEMLAVLREALSNVARHAAASQVDVTVTTGSRLVLSVLDNGQGIAEPGPRSGLANLAERARALGGTLQVSTAAQGGTELTWTVPLPATP
jgi:signal transduction histidine kinase